MGRETADHGAEGVIFFHIGTGQRRFCFLFSAFLLGNISFLLSLLFSQRYCNCRGASVIWDVGCMYIKVASASELLQGGHCHDSYQHVYVKPT